MAKTRLNNADRNAIAEAIIDHKYVPLEQAHAQRGHDLANELWEILHGEHRQLIDALPKGALEEAHKINVNAAGRHIELRFGPDVSSWPSVYRPVFYKYARGRVPVDDLAGRDFADRLDTWLGEGKTLREERAEQHTKTLAVLSTFTSFDDLQAAWPDADKFITAQWRKRGVAGGRNLPAVMISDLSRQLGLPPGEQEAAQ